MTEWSNRDIRGYALGECIGRGGSGAVYRAYQASVDRTVAVKVILPELANQPEFIRRFEFEARLVAQLEHPHIVPLYDFWREADSAYLVMRWLNRSLRTALNGKAWSLDAVARLLDQIGSSLVVAHRRNIIHRDIKPENILLDEDGNAYLADFGIAKQLDMTGDTTGGSFKGTPSYVAPEQIKGEPVTPQTDIYLLGLLLYELITGERPYKEATSPAAMLIKHLTDPLPRLTVSRVDLQRGLNEVIQKATAKKASERYADVGQLITALHTVIDASDVPVIEETDGLTGREREIIALLAQELSTQDIANRLGIASSTAKWYVKQLYDKLDVHSRHEAHERARQLVEMWSGSASEQLLSNSPIQPLTNYTDNSTLENPYKGLRAFQEGDSEDFFGRTALIERLIKRLGEGNTDSLASTVGGLSRFLAVIGPSGSGKSSVVRAGLLPRLRRGALAASEKWFIVTMFPGAYPFEELESALASVAVNPPSDMIAQLRQNTRGLLRVVKRILPRDEETALLLVIDQFEEVFTLVEDEAERSMFLDSLRLALADPRGRLRVIITLRADFTDRPLQYMQFGELMRQRIEYVLPLAPDELRQAIIGPTERFGISVEPSLVTTIVADVTEQPGALPLLQFALTELFERREGRRLTLNAYRASGGVAGALARRADELFDQLTQDGQEAARQLFLRLVTLGDVDNTRRRVLRAELGTLVDQPGFLDAVIEAYNQYRLLTLDRDPATRAPTVEVAHEALLRTWARLRTWIEEAHDDIRAQRQLALSAAEWEASQHDDSFLATGARLGRFETLITHGIITLNEDEHRYLGASITYRDALDAIEQTQREREAELTRQAVENATVAQRALHQSEYLRLAAEANLLLDRQEISSEVSALLALRSLNIEYNAEAEHALLVAMDRGFPLHRSYPHLGYIWGLAFSANGSLFAAGSWDGSTTIWETVSGREIFKYAIKDSVNGMEFSKNGQYLAVVSSDKSLRIWDIFAHTEEHRISTERGLTFLALSPKSENHQVLVGGDGYAALWDYHQNRELHRFIFQASGQTQCEVAFSLDGKYALTGGDGVQLWNVSSGKLVRQYSYPASPCSVAFTLDGKYILSAYQDKHIIWWDIESDNIIDKRYLDYDGDIQYVAFAPNQTLAVICGTNGAYLWNIKTGTQIRQLDRSVSSLRAAFSPDETKLLSGGIDGFVHVWPCVNPTQTNTHLIPNGKWAILGPNSEKLDWAIVPDKSNINVSILNRISGETIAELDRVLLVNRVMYLLNDRWFFLNSFVLKKIMLYDTKTWQKVREYQCHPRGAWCMDVSPDQRMLAIGIASDLIQLLNIETGEEITQYEVAGDGILEVNFLSNDLLFFTCPDITAILNIHTGMIETAFSDYAQKLTTACISLDQHYLAGVDATGTIHLWDMLTKQKLFVFLSFHIGIVGDCRFTLDGDYLFTSGVDGTARIWDWRTGTLKRIVKPLRGQLRSCYLSPDSRHILIISDDDMLSEFSFDYTEDVELALRHLPYDLTETEMSNYNIRDRRLLTQLTWEKRM